MLAAMSVFEEILKLKRAINFIFVFLIEVYLVYTIILVSDIQPSDSVFLQIILH